MHHFYWLIWIAMNITLRLLVITYRKNTPKFTTKASIFQSFQDQNKIQNKANHVAAI